MQHMPSVFEQKGSLVKFCLNHELNSRCWSHKLRLAIVNLLLNTEVRDHCILGQAFITLSPHF